MAIRRSPALPPDRQSAAGPPNILDAAGCLLIVSEVGTGVVTAMNKTAEDLTGFTRDQVIGVPLWDLVAPIHQQMLKRTLRDPLGNGLPVSFESTVNLRAGKPRRVVWTSTYLTDDAGVQSHIVMTGIDISSEAASGGLFAHLMGAANSTALMSTDRRGRVTYCSSGAEQLLGIRGEQLVGHHMPLTMFDSSELQARASLSGLAPDVGVLAFDERADQSPADRSNPLQVRDWTLTHADGRRLIASVAIYAAYDAHGLHVGFVGIAHDVTERRRANQVLADALVVREKAVERLHELDRVKSEFVATLSHELRTPVSSIVGSTEMLQDGLGGELTSVQQSMLQTIERNCGRLIALADDLVALARIDAGDFDLDMSELDLRQVVLAARESVQTLLLDRSLDTVLDVPEVPVVIRGDAEQLSRSIVNLVSNAIKFTDDGGRITCRLTREADQAVLTVSDSGVGIPRTEQRDLFTRFFRSSTARERASQGSGMGLSIVASIVHQHGGQIFVDSEHLEGSTFTVHIPLSRVHGPGAAVPTRADPVRHNGPAQPL